MKTLQYLTLILCLLGVWLLNSCTFRVAADGSKEVTVDGAAVLEVVKAK